MAGAARGTDQQSFLPGFAGEGNPFHPGGGSQNGLFLHSLNHRFGLAGNDVHLLAAAEANHPGQLCRHCFLAAEAGMQAAFFNIDQGEFRVRGQRIGGAFFLFKIILQIAAAALLVEAQHQPGIALHGNAQRPDGLHGIQGAQRGALVVGGAPPVDSVLRKLHGEGVRHRPAVSGGNHIQMGQNVQSLGHFRRQIRGNHIIIIIGGLHAGAAKKLHTGGGTSGVPFAEGHSFLGLGALAVDGNQGFQILQQIGKLLVQIDVQFFVIHGTHPFLLIVDSSCLIASPTSL